MMLKTVAIKSSQMNVLYFAHYHEKVLSQDIITPWLKLALFLDQSFARSL